VSRQAQCAYLRLKIGALWAAGDDELSIRHVSENVRHGVDGEIETLFEDNSADCEKTAPLRRREGLVVSADGVGYAAHVSKLRVQSARYAAVSEDMAIVAEERAKDAQL